jgi:acyl-CoA thioesterase-1
VSTLIEKNAVVLFQGDSITDAGRNREDGSNLGLGYAYLAAAWFSSMHPELNVRFLNRGIGGNTVKDLHARWQADCLDLKPTWVSVLVGINEAARRYAHNDPMPHEEYEATYRDILTQARESCNARLILLEPFVLPTEESRVTWREDLDPKIQIVRQLAREFKAPFIPLDGLFAQAAAKRELAFWAVDGVHPSPAGHAMMARAWLETVKAL